MIGSIDAVLISHDHYDHLSKSAVLALHEKEIPFYVPLGVGGHLESWGIPKETIHVGDWWDSFTIGTVELTLVPSRHASGRSLTDYMQTL